MSPIYESYVMDSADGIIVSESLYKSDLKNFKKEPHSAIKVYLSISLMWSSVFLASSLCPCNRDTSDIASST